MNPIILLLAFIGTGFIVFVAKIYIENSLKFRKDPFKYHAEMMEINEKNYEAWKDFQIKSILDEVNGQLGDSKTISITPISKYAFEIRIKEDGN